MTDIRPGVMERARTLVFAMDELLEEFSNAVASVTLAARALQDAEDRARYAAMQEAEGGNSGEIGWLVERDENGPIWFTAEENENQPQEYWFAVDANWTKDSTRALRFSRKSDAENFIRYGRFPYDVTATEHAWGFHLRALATKPAEPTITVSEHERLIKEARASGIKEAVDEINAAAARHYAAVNAAREAPSHD